MQSALATLHGADLILISAPDPNHLPSALVVLRAHAPPDRIRAILQDPPRYRDAVPALARADVIAHRRAPTPPAEIQDLEWELEIPLFNLKGRATLVARPNGAELTLVDGDLAPGKLAFTWDAAAGPAPASTSPAVESVLSVEATINVSASGWLFRRIVSRSPFGASAMNATAAWVVLRAIAELAEHPADAPARRPRAAPAPPPAAALDGRDLGAPALGPLRARGVVAAIRRAPSGRLSSVAIAVPVALGTATLERALAAPDSWRAFPGWHEVTRLPAGTVEVSDNLPFVDFDATWATGSGSPIRVTAVDGATRGALFGWDVLPAAAGAGAATATASLAIFSLYPRLETAGYIPRRFIEAEPLLEHGMALALAFADAMSMKQRLEHHP